MSSVSRDKDVVMRATRAGERGERDYADRGLPVLAVCGDWRCSGGERKCV